MTWLQDNLIFVKKPEKCKKDVCIWGELMPTLEFVCAAKVMFDWQLKRGMVSKKKKSL